MYQKPLGGRGAVLRKCTKYDTFECSEASIFLNKKYRDVGVGALCGVQFLDELFSNYPLRKIYIDVYDYNKQSLACNLGIGFVEEGCLKGYRYNNGEYHDMHLLSITREKFYEKAGGFLKRHD